MPSELTKKVLITGATGGIGQSLIPVFLENNYQILAITRDAEKAQKMSFFNEVDFIELDIYREFQNLNIDSDIGVVHLAWQGLPNYRSEFHIGENLPLNYAFIKYLVQNGIKNFLISGTCAEYGLQNGMLKSSAPTLPNTQYAFAKDALHKQLRFLQNDYEFNLKWARLFYIYGEGGERNNSILKQLDKAIDDGDKTFNMSQGEQLRDYLAIEEVANQLFVLFESQKNGAFNVCSGEPISIRSLVESHIEKRGSQIEINAGYYPYLDYEPMEFWGEKDISV